MTILDAIQRSADFLAKKGVASPRLQVELLVAHVLKMPRLNLYLQFEKPLAPAEEDALRQLVVRRGQREPLQYIVGSTSFCGLEIEVNPRVLIPRPETELLAERAWKVLLDLPAAAGLRALDLCAGSGCLAVALAANAPAARLLAADISAGALDVARRNAARHNLSARIDFAQGDAFAAVPRQTKFDLIVSNPPYVPSKAIAALEPEVRDFEPHGALDGGADGLDFYRRIAAEAKPFLKPGARVMVELEADGAEAAREIFQRADWVIDAMERDDAGLLRILIARP